jgi:hypothetical protein
MSDRGSGSSARRRGQPRMGDGELVSAGAGRAIAILIRRTLTRTSAPILNSLRRMSFIDEDLVSQRAHDPEVVADEQICKAVAGLQFMQ